MGLLEIVRVTAFVSILGSVLYRKSILQQIRIRRYSRGRELKKQSRPLSSSKKPENSLRWGNQFLPESAATQHFLAVGTTGSGKSQVQRLLMEGPLTRIVDGSDSRAVLFDAKGDVTAYLKKIGVTAPVYSLNPFEARDSFPKAVSWDIAKDITSPARALNLSCSLIKQEKGGNNSYFSDAARLVVTGVVESFMRQAGTGWTFSDLVYATLSQKRLEEVLGRDEAGREIIEGLLGDDRTGYAVASTVVSKMRYYTSVAALWQRSTARISVRDWLEDNSILLLGSNATAKSSLDALNEQIFKVLVEEIDLQANSSTRRTWVWLDEARLAGSLLQNDLLPFLAVKGRSRGACLVLSFQDMEGFREAAGPRAAAEIVGQCSNKALLRMESDESASWAAKVLGQLETIELFRSHSTTGLGLKSAGKNQSEQRVVKDAVLASEFYNIPVTDPENGLTGYFVTPTAGACRTVIPAPDIEKVVVQEAEESAEAIVFRAEADQWLRDWTPEDRKRLRLEPIQELCDLPLPAPRNLEKPALRLRTKQANEIAPMLSEMK
jgi:hypothetical protein